MYSTYRLTCFYSIRVHYAYVKAFSYCHLIKNWFSLNIYTFVLINPYYLSNYSCYLRPFLLNIEKFYWNNLFILKATLEQRNITSNDLFIEETTQKISLFQS